MRGTRTCSRNEGAKVWFIPAYAGNTRLSSATAGNRLVHPRVCGEHFGVWPSPVTISGSSPRMRGTLTSVRTPAMPRRFIPAYAGNTDRSRHFRPSKPVHPRVCGEHNGSTRLRCASTGSSPRMRGTRCNYATRQNRQRFIPAYAGNTIIGGWIHAPLTVHPRVCGEHRVHSMPRCSQAGSSPRMRGTRPERRLARSRRRFIPAYAGNTRNTERR